MHGVRQSTTGPTAKLRRNNQGIENGGTQSANDKSVTVDTAKKRSSTSKGRSSSVAGVRLIWL